MKYDDASWHSGGDFPKDLGANAGATHIGIFVAWALLSDLGGQLHLEELPEGLSALRMRKVTPGEFLLLHCDGKFTDEDLNDRGNYFAAHYYEAEPSRYLHDYEVTFMAKSLFRRPPASLYHVRDSWANFEKIEPVLARRFAEWSAR